MIRRFPLPPIVSAVLVVCLLIQNARAQDDEQQLRLPHSHQPLIIDSAPPINRLPIQHKQVRRLFTTDDGRILAAEWETGSVLELSPDGQSARKLEVGLNQPSGIVRDSSGAYFITLYGDGIPGAGELVRIRPMTRPERICGDLSGPSDLAISKENDFLITEYQTGRLLRVQRDGRKSVLVEGIPRMNSLAVSDTGRVYFTSRSNGSLYRYFPGDIPEKIVQHLDSPSDVQISPDGTVLVTNSESGDLIGWDETSRRSFLFGKVPRGTLSLTFLGDGNFVIGLEQYDFLMQITRQIHVPCPHCRDAIPLRFQSSRHAHGPQL